MKEWFAFITCASLCRVSHSLCPPMRRNHSRKHFEQRLCIVRKSISMKSFKLPICCVYKKSNWNSGETLFEPSKWWTHSIIYSSSSMQWKIMKYTNYELKCVRQDEENLQISHPLTASTAPSLAQIDHGNWTTCLPNNLMILLKSETQTERLTWIGPCVGWSDTPQRGGERWEEAGEVMAW